MTIPLRARSPRMRSAVTSSPSPRAHDRFATSTSTRAVTVLLCWPSRGAVGDDSVSIPSTLVIAVIDWYAAAAAAVSPLSTAMVPARTWS